MKRSIWWDLLALVGLLGAVYLLMQDRWDEGTCLLVATFWADYRGDRSEL